MLIDNVENILADNDDVPTGINKVQILRKIKAKGHPKKRIAKSRKTIIDKISYTDMKRKRGLEKQQPPSVDNTTNY